MASGARTQLDALLKLRHAAKDIALFARQRSRSQLAGGNKTLFRGRGLEFEEVRHYQAGDELRAIDWRVTARTGVAHTKLFREERERPVFVLVDQRQTMAFGSQQCFKSVQAAEVAALVGWAALHHNDRIGGLVFNDQRHTEIRPTRNRSAVLRLLNVLDNYACALVEETAAGEANPSVNLAAMLAELRRVARPGSAVFIISDFADFNPDCAKQLHQLARHCDVNAIMVYDAMEHSLPAQGSMAFTDGERRAELNTSDAALRSAFAQSFEQRLTQMQSELRKLSIELNLLATHEGALEALAQWYRPGARRASARTTSMAR